MHTIKERPITYRADIKPMRRFVMGWVVRAIVGILVLGVVAVLVAGAFTWRWAFHDLPELPGNAVALWEVRRESSITMVDSEGQRLVVRGPRYERPVRLDELPSHVPQAFLAIEDRRFYEHDGVDRRGLMRAMMLNLQAGSTVQGGSTLTMQLVKNLILSPERTIRRKLQEIRIALTLEERLSKDEILELYLNRVYLGERAYGIEAAAQTYFDKSASELTVAEAAILAALPKAPSRLAPTDNLEAARARAEDVLQAMLDADYIDPLTYLSAVTMPADLSQSDAAGFDPAVFGHVFDAAVAEAELALSGPLPDVVTIEVSIDPELQQTAHTTLTEFMGREGAARNAGEAALAAIDMTGRVRAMVGGRDYRESQFNRVTQAERQPGSAFKPVVFVAGFEAGLDPSSTFRDRPIDIEGWTPENYGGGFRGMITIADALKRSVNTIAAQVGNEVGPQAVAEMAQRLGVRSELNVVPALSLGAGEVHLIELTAVYAAFANDGRRTDPVLVTEIRDARGDLIWAAPEPAPGRQVIERDHARWMSTMLQSVVLDGTGTRARLNRHVAAGKTGTSQNSRDAWFVGYTGYLTTAVWIGNDDDTPTDQVTGGQLPAQLWRAFMTEAHQGLEPRALSAPAPRRRTAREESLAAFYSDLSARFSDVVDPPSP